MSKVDLKLDWCSYEAAKYAVEHWHYSKSLPASKNVYVGVWEDNQFIGCVIFGRGANNNMHKPFNLEMIECVELVRVALKEHKTPVSKIVSISLKMLKKQSNGVRLIVSYADPAQNHAGGIYQAGNWIYAGAVPCTPKYLVRGKWVHARQANSLLGSTVGLERKPVPDKHKYLFPLDDAMRKQIEPLRKPYPKRDTGETDNAAQSNEQTEGASPIVSLKTDN
mgnify:CR=1 FL=1